MSQRFHTVFICVPVFVAQTFEIISWFWILKLKFVSFVCLKGIEGLRVVLHVQTMVYFYGKQIVLNLILIKTNFAKNVQRRPVESANLKFQVFLFESDH